MEFINIKMLINNITDDMRHQYKSRYIQCGELTAIFQKFIILL